MGLFDPFRIQGILGSYYYSYHCSCSPPLPPLLHLFPSPPTTKVLVLARKADFIANMIDPR